MILRAQGAVCWSCVFESVVTSCQTAKVAIIWWFPTGIDNWVHAHTRCLSEAISTMSITGFSMPDLPSGCYLGSLCQGFRGAEAMWSFALAASKPKMNAAIIERVIPLLCFPERQVVDPKPATWSRSDHHRQSKHDGMITSVRPQSISDCIAYS